MQTDRSTDKQKKRQTDKLSFGPTPKAKNRQGAGSAISFAYYIPVLKPDAASRPPTSIIRPTASLPLRPRYNERGLEIYA